MICYPIRVANPTCDLLLTDGVVLTMDPQVSVHRPGAVAVTGDSIVAVGPGALAYDAVETINCGGRVIMPGLVNAHTHLELSVMRGRVPGGRGSLRRGRGVRWGDGRVPG